MKKKKKRIVKDYSEVPEEIKIILSKEYASTFDVNQLDFMHDDIELEYIEVSEEVKIRLSKEPSYSSDIEELNFLKHLFEKQKSK
ncbi:MULTISPECIES: hypothetical protein [Pseudomonas]|jgi:hypothetical protein|uniref:hypothetical protein n=1 Tax=Pseudomonas TaxID=286 RepID=UPI0015E33F63|nr:MULTISPECIES: hypothetical protein [Pseudomonas]MBA1300089.1 hypothetical protein [Pseudomonas carnis]MBJ2202969.1 hypothetical protein [Pseudomonas carnis]MBW9243990.1 hypothetical protein [Pseudomonas paracarnis]ULN82668.1 hypothetical protein HXW87_10940 [Pseudomonas sp. Y5-11]